MSEFEDMGSGVERYSVPGGWVYDFDGNRVVFVPDNEAPDPLTYALEAIAMNLEDIACYLEKLTRAKPRPAMVMPEPELNNELSEVSVG